MNKFSLTSITFAVLLLNGCFRPDINRRTNPTLVGEYTGKNAYDETQCCRLTVTEISESEYQEAERIDVVKNLVLEGYYFLEFYISHPDKEDERLHFYNLRDAYNGATAISVSYKDDNETWFTPHTDVNGVEPYYSVHFSEHTPNEIYAYVYLNRGNV